MCPLLRLFLEFRVEHGDRRNLLRDALRHEELVGGRERDGDRLQREQMDIAKRFEEEIAAQKANLKNYRIINLPEETNTIEKILTGISGKIKMEYLKSEYGSGYTYYQEFARIKSISGIQTRLPVNLNIQ
jgi:protease-4